MSNEARTWAEVLEEDRRLRPFGVSRIISEKSSVCPRLAFERRFATLTEAEAYLAGKEEEDYQIAHSDPDGYITREYRFGKAGEGAE